MNLHFCRKFVQQSIARQPILYILHLISSLQWRHNDHDGVSNHQPHHCLLSCLFGHRSKKTSKLRVTGLCEGNSPVTGDHPITILWMIRSLPMISTIYEILTNVDELLNIFRDVVNARNIYKLEDISITWWRHQMEAFSALLAICVGNSPVPDEFPSRRPVTQSFDVFFDLRLNKRLNKQSWGWWFPLKWHGFLWPSHEIIQQWTLPK